MSEAERSVYRFGDLVVDAGRECLVKEGSERHLRRKAYLVLVHLLENRGRLVSKDELFGTVWHDSTVTDDVLVQCITDIRRAIGDDPHHPRFIKTVPKSGYRFIGEVSETVPSECPTGPAQVEIGPEGPEIRPEYRAGREERPRLLRYADLVVVTLAGFFILGSALYFALPALRPAAGSVAVDPDARRVLAIFPFQNSSGAAEIDWMRQGLADMLSTGLARAEKLNVLDRARVSPSNSESMPGMEAPVESGADAARKLDADIFVLGSFAQIGPSVRVDVELYDTRRKTLIAAETLTVPRAEQLLTEVDLLSLRIANRLNARTGNSPPPDAVGTNDLEAFRLYSVAVERANGLQNKEAISLLEKAIKLDPEFAMAYARIGYTYAVAWGQTKAGKPYLEKAFRLSSRLTEKDRLNIAAWYAIANADFRTAIDSYENIIKRFPLETEAYWRRGRLLAGEGRRDESIAVLKQGLAVDPDSSRVYNTLGQVLSGLGRHDEAISAHQRYVALSPQEPNSYDSLGMSYQWAGEYARAIENYERALAIDPEFEIALIHLANARARLGQYNNAIELIKRFVAYAPSELERGRGSEFLAYLYLRKGEVALAEKAAAEADRVNEGVHWSSYMIAAQQGRRSKIAEIEKKIASISEYVDRGSRVNSRFEAYYLGSVEMRRGNVDRAIGFFRDAVSHAPPTWNYLDFEDSLGLGLLTAGRYEEAAAEFERILRLSPNYPTARFHLARCLNAAGRRDEAAQNYEKFLQEWKDADQDLPEIIEATRELALLVSKGEA